MGAIMLIFAISFAGEAGTMALQYESMEACEADRASVIIMAKASPTPSGSPVAYIAALCTIPIKVEEV